MPRMAKEECTLPLIRYYNLCYNNICIIYLQVNLWQSCLINGFLVRLGAFCIYQKTKMQIHEKHASAIDKAVTYFYLSVYALQKRYAGDGYFKSCFDLRYVIYGFYVLSAL